MKLEITTGTRSCWERAGDVLVPGAQDYLRISDHPEFPRFFTDAQGAFLTGENGQHYLDLYLGSGAVILGHGNPAQITAVRDALQHGATVSLRHPVEIAVAEHLKQMIPLIERVMFFKTGSECVHMALQTALRTTGRTSIISLGYHGWVFPFNWPVNEQVKNRLYTPLWDLEEVKACASEAGQNLAAIIVSPSPHMTDPAFYQAVNAIAHAQNALFIMDEVKSGFRWHFPCVSTAWGLTPDLLLLSKAIANGFPLAALAGRNAILGNRDIVSVFSTYASENVSLTASLVVLEQLQHGGYEQFAQTSYKLFELLTDGFSGTPIRVTGCPTFFRLELSDAFNKADTAMAMAHRGVLFHPKDEVLVSMAHAEHGIVQRSADTLCGILTEMYRDGLG